MRKTKEEAMRTRQAVLKAAAQVISQHGVSAFTIEAVAQETGVTKGGVLHHFPTKEALIDDLIGQVIEAFNVRLAEELKAEPEGEPGRWLRAYIRTVFLMPYEDKNLIPALAAAVAADHKLLDRIRSSVEQSYRAATEDGLDPLEASIIRLAVDGVVYGRALGIYALDETASRKIYNELLARTRQQVVKA